MTRPLLSTPSAAGRPALFGRFVDTTGLSDSSNLSIVGYAFRLPSAPHVVFVRGEVGGLPDSNTVVPHMHGVSDLGEPERVSLSDVLRCCLPPALTTSALSNGDFVAHNPAYACPYQRSAHSLAAVSV